MPKLQITTEEANHLMHLLGDSNPNLKGYIKDENERYIPTIMGLPKQGQIPEEGIEILDDNRNPYIVYFFDDEDEPYSVFESLGEDAGSDDDPIAEFKTYEPIAEFKTYEQLREWWNKLNQ